MYLFSCTNISFCETHVIYSLKEKLLSVCKINIKCLNFMLIKAVQKFVLHSLSSGIEIHIYFLFYSNLQYAN